MAKAKRPPQTRKKLGGPKIDGHRTAKVAAVEDLGTRFEGATAVLVSEYRGMTVGELKELRTNLRDAGADYKVYKNTLATIAARKAGLDELVPHLTGPTAFTFTTGDPVVAAKRLTDFAKKVPTLVLKGGVLERKVLSTADVTALGNLESREVMLSRAAGMFLAPIQKVANLFAAPLNQLGSLLVQLRDKLPSEAGPTPVVDVPAPDAPAGDTAPEAAPTEASAEVPAAEGATDAAAEPAAQTAQAPEAEGAQAPEATQTPETTEG